MRGQRGGDDSDALDGAPAAMWCRSGQPGRGSRIRCVRWKWFQALKQQLPDTPAQGELGVPKACSLFCRMSFMHTSNLHPPPSSKRPPCNKSKTPKASVFTEEPHRITTFQQNVPVWSGISGDGTEEGRVVPCEHAPPPPRNSGLPPLPPTVEIVGGKISGICIEEISLWPQIKFSPAQVPILPTMMATTTTTAAATTSITSSCEAQGRPHAGQQSAPHRHVLVCLCSNVRQSHHIPFPNQQTSTCTTDKRSQCSSVT